MKGRNKRKKRWYVVTMLMISSVCFAFFRSQSSRAIFDEQDAVTYAEFSATHPIENTTLFIGTYLIPMEQLTDQLYEKAQSSANDANQFGRYYKSELSEGAWYDITNAQGLSDISTGGTIAENEELAPLFVTHYVTREGVIHLAIDDSIVFIFDSPSPYDLYNLPELESIRMQYDNLFSEESTGVDAYYYKTIKEFFDTDCHTEKTNELDAQLLALQGVYDSLRQAKETQKAETVHSLMGKIDAARRAEVFTQLSQTDDNLLGKLQNSCNGQGYVQEDYDNKEFIINASVGDAIGTGIQNCDQSYMKHASAMLKEEDGVLASAEYEKSMAVINAAPAGNSAEMGNLIIGLRSILNIKESLIKDKKAELEVINQYLPKAEAAYKEKVNLGESGRYVQSKGNISAAALSQILEEDKTAADAAKSELQCLIKAKTSRMDTDAAIKYAEECLDAADRMKLGILQDDFKTKATESVEAYILWLKELVAELLSSADGKQSALDKLESEKLSLLNQKKEALDNNDLSGAKKADALLEAVDKNIQEEENRLKNAMDQAGSSKEQAGLESSLGNSSLSNNLNQLKNDALSAMMDGNSEALSDAASGLSALGAEQALKELSEKAGDKDMKDLLDRAAKDSKNSGLYGIYDGNGVMTSEELLSLLEGLLGQSFDSLSTDGKIIAVSACNRLGKTGIAAGTDLAEKLMTQCVDEKNPYVYPICLSAGNKSYLALQVVAGTVKYRYVYDDGEKEVILTKGGGSYLFRVQSKEAVLPDGSIGKLGEPVLFENRPYLDEKSAGQYFRVSAEYIGKMKHAACLSEGMDTGAEELFTQIQEAIK